MTDTTLRQIDAALTMFQPVYLADMQECALQDRIDTKFVIGLSQLESILEQISSQYRVLEINKVRLNRYQTLYFDTPDFQLYRQHHNGLASRYKIRARRYVISDLAFFEVKHKTNRERTIKSRIAIPEVSASIDNAMHDFVDLHSPFHAGELEPKLWNEYLRITLVGSETVERVTLDVNLAFSHDDVTSTFPGIAIAEVKMAQRTQASAFNAAMRRSGIQPLSFSKYTAGVYMLYQNVKANNFKPQFRQVQKIVDREQLL